MDAPTTVADLADAAFRRAAEAFAAGRTDEAQRLLRLMEQARRVANTPRGQGSAPSTAGPGGEPAPEPVLEPPPPLAADEVVVTIEQLINMTERWAELMILGELRDIPAAMIHVAAQWRRANLGRLFHEADRQRMLDASPSWAFELYEADGTGRALPSLEELGGYVWSHRDFPATAQVPPKVHEGARRRT